MCIAIGDISQKASGNQLIQIATDFKTPVDDLVLCFTVAGENTMEKYLSILKQKEEQLAPVLMKDHGVICRQLSFGNTSPLYLAKPHWTNRFDPDKESTIGIFYAIWVTPNLISEKKFAYNIHSKKLRDLPGHKLTSRNFADEFRAAVREKVAIWPGVRLDYGPGTLLEGRDVCDLDSFGDHVEKRIADFIDIYAEIDKLLLSSAT